MLVFGRAPASDAEWIADVLEANGVAFVCGEGDSLVPLNDGARQTRLFASWPAVGELGELGEQVLCPDRRKR